MLGIQIYFTFDHTSNHSTSAIDLFNLEPRVQELEVMCRKEGRQEKVHSVADLHYRVICNGSEIKKIYFANQNGKTVYTVKHHDCKSKH